MRDKTDVVATDLLIQFAEATADMLTSELVLVIEHLRLGVDDLPRVTGKAQHKENAQSVSPFSCGCVVLMVTEDLKP